MISQTFSFLLLIFLKSSGKFFAKCPSYFGLSDICSGLNPGYSLSVEMAQKG